MGRVRALIESCWVGLRREHVRDVTNGTIEIPGIWNPRNLARFQEFLFHYSFNIDDDHD